jgi:hypothetical protein
MKVKLITVSVVAFSIAATGSAQSPTPTYWGLGLHSPTPFGSGWSSDSRGSGLSAEFGQYFTPEIGYNVRVTGLQFTSNSATIRGSYVDSDFTYFSAGINYSMPNSKIVFSANATYGSYDTTKGIALGEDGYFVRAHQLKQGGAIGIEVGMRVWLRWGLWGEINYHYTPLDKNQVMANSIQYYGLNLKYLWGKP